MEDLEDRMKKYSLIMLIIGVILFIFTVVSIIVSYTQADEVQELVMPMIYNFVPFSIAFVLLKISISNLKNKKNSH